MRRSAVFTLAVLVAFGSCRAARQSAAASVRTRAEPAGAAERPEMKAERPVDAIFLHGTYTFLITTGANDVAAPLPWSSDESVAEVEYRRAVAPGQYQYRVTALKEGSAEVGAYFDDRKASFALLVQSAAPAIPDPVLLQNPELPSGCEITALTNVLNFYGYNVSKTYMADQMPADSTVEVSDGRLYMPNPADVFVGDPRSSGGFGCYAPVIAQTAEEYLVSAGSGLTAEDITGAEPEELYSYLLARRPVLVWATIGMSPVTWDSKWYDLRTGEPYQWLGGEHVLVLLGADSGTVTMMDPLRGIQTYGRSLFETRYREVGRQAVILQ